MTGNEYRILLEASTGMELPIFLKSHFALWANVVKTFANFAQHHFNNTIQPSTCMKSFPEPNHRLESKAGTKSYSKLIDYTPPSNPLERNCTIQHEKPCLNNSLTYSP